MRTADKATGTSLQTDTVAKAQLNVPGNHNTDTQTYRLAETLKVNVATQTYLSKGYSIAGWNRNDGKAPKVKDWDKQSITSARHNQNIGIIHGLSGTFCFDIDDMKLTRQIFRKVFSINLDKLIADHYGWYGNPERVKLLMRVPDYAKPGLKAVKLAYPIGDNRKGEAFSLRGATRSTAGELKAVQDVLPPSIHPDTKKPYMWRYGDVLPTLWGLPYMPDYLLGIWQDWGVAKTLMEEFLGWAEKPKPQQKCQVYNNDFKHRTGDSLIDKFNNSTDIIKLLEGYGYIHKGGNKWISPNSSTNTPGVMIMEDDNGKRVAYTHHGSDTWNNGHTWDAFGLFAHFEYGDNMKAAAGALKGTL